jgi:hypothetical protein
LNKETDGKYNNFLNFKQEQQLWMKNHNIIYKTISSQDHEGFNSALADLSREIILNTTFKLKYKVLKKNIPNFYFPRIFDQKYSMSQIRRLILHILDRCEGLEFTDYQDFQLWANDLLKIRCKNYSLLL